MSKSSWTIGSVRITRVEESSTTLAAEDLFAGATTEGLARYRSWLKPFVDADDRLIISMQTLLVESDGKKIVVDTCVGPAAPAAFAGIVIAGSPFLDNLASVGFDRESVDYVVCTHLHFDHIGWNTIAEGASIVPTFPNARYIVTRDEWEAFSKSLANTGGEIDFYGLRESVQPLESAGLLDLVEPGYRVTDQVWLEGTPGHSSGHVSVRIDSGDESALITGDMTHHPVQWAEPGWSAHADADQVQSTATRRRLLSEHTDSAILILGTHYPPPCAGYLVTGPDGCRFEAAGDERPPSR